jgi:outer membrane protein, heavy metal efflux system
MRYSIAHRPVFKDFRVVVPSIIVLLSLAYVTWEDQINPQPADSAYRVFAGELNTLVSEALKNNTGLKASSLLANEAGAAAHAGLSIDAPQVGIEFMNSPVANFPNLLRNQMEIDYSAQQMLPFPGKRAAMELSLLKRREMAEADTKTAGLDLADRVKTSFFELYLVDRKIEVNREGAVLTQRMLDIARKQYELGLVSQASVLRAESELGRYSVDSAGLVQERTSMAAMINALCNRPVNTVVAPTPAIEPAPLALSIEKLLALAEKNRPELSAMRSEQAMQDAESAASRKEYLPDFMVKATYKQMSATPDGWGLMIGATVPVAPWSIGSHAWAVKQSAFAGQSTQARYENMKAMIESEVASALGRNNAGQERAAITVKVIIPKARQALESAQASYRTGKEEMLMLIDIQRMLVMAELDYQMAAMDVLAARARLERAVGLSIDEIVRYTEGSGS